MPNIDEVFASKYLKAADLTDDVGDPIDMTVTITKAWTEEYEDKKSGETQKKIGLAFKETPKGLLCNVTNSRRIAQLLGSGNTDKWIGKRITLYQTEVDFGGQQTPAIRIRGKLPGHERAAGVGHAPPQRTPDDPRTMRAAPKDERDNWKPADLDDEVPF